jgi:hypothetical protein
MSSRLASLQHSVRPCLTMLLLLGGAGGSRVGAQATGGSTPEDSVRVVETSRAQVLLRGDTAALSRLVGDEFVEISRLGQLRSKADNIRDIGSGDLRLLSVKYDSLAVRIYGDVAVLTGIADNAGTFRGVPFTGKIRYMRIFVRRAGRWQAVAMQQTPLQ